MNQSVPAATPLRIDYICDITCPWCAIGLAGLLQALAHLHDTLETELHFQPFELNPQLTAEGGDADQRLRQEYGIDAAQIVENRARVRERAAQMGIAYNITTGSRVWNTFDAHRLVHWAGQQDRDKAIAVKQALFVAYFTHEHNISDHAVLAAVAQQCGLDGGMARAYLDSDAGVHQLRTLEEYSRRLGITSVPATLIAGQYMIPGGQPPEVFATKLREVIAGQHEPS